MSKNERCDNCHKTIQSGYKFCPICGHDLSSNKIDESTNKVLESEVGSSEKAKAAKFSVSQIILRSLGISLLMLDLILLVWFCWSAYVGHFVKFNKPVLKTVVSIDGEFFNLAGEDSLYHNFLIALILFGLMKIGFWLIKFRGPSSS
jgi:RNA polymerase subunit RPABC4/transcription elongation factor Spt4